MWFFDFAVHVGDVIGVGDVQFVGNGGGFEAGLSFQPIELFQEGLRLKVGQRRTRLTQALTRDQRGSPKCKESRRGIQVRLKSNTFSE